ncbi:hypothetical protein LGH70_05100 [Hymenobacter sp. BT635]|uniref:ASCH domain-containing protein n=1 Tax=Hymenobacter nitidus TaxID=2880929 RepID=A0ABS8AB27_9BACT|nr:hypothetical protein [Hymenobacter nitidus]MCB2376947.1 hypothetical protein [Hymenobacter nitidus]
MHSSAEQTISFNPAMREALRQNRKTVTRRRFSSVLPLNDTPDDYCFLRMEQGHAVFASGPLSASPELRIDCPFGSPGTRLLVAEEPNIILEVTHIRAERTQAITEAEAQAEGITVCESSGAEGSASTRGYCAEPHDPHCSPQRSAIAAFRILLTSIYPTAWARNEWVWVVQFRRCQLGGAIRPE